MEKLEGFNQWHLQIDGFAIHLFDHEHLWLHIVVHVVLVAMPAAFICFAVWMGFRGIRWFIARDRKTPRETSPPFSKIPNHVFSFITQYSFRYQIVLSCGALATLPITYAGLELPKQIINNALDNTIYLTDSSKQSLQVDILLFLCGLYLLVLILSGVLKFLLNYYKGTLSENLIRRLRLYLFHKRGGDSGQSGKPSLVPVIIQEVEPVCGFSGDSFTVPLLQGGTALTIILFMMMQNLALGAAAITLLPIQLFLIPRFQRKINQLIHQRIGVVRTLSDHLSTSEHITNEMQSGEIRHLFARLQTLRLKIFRTKYMMKTINNFIMNLTPFFFYTIGGYLVIEGRLSIGALVASLASYKDLAPAIRAMFSYYQSFQDARVRYEEIYSFAHQDQGGVYSRS